MVLRQKVGKESTLTKKETKTNKQKKKVKNEFWIISIKELNDKRPSKKNIINMIILKVA